jgi:ABC-2 type transport system permease protein
VRTLLGLGRGAGAKVAPWLFIALAVLPALGLIVIQSFAASLSDASEEFDLPSYAEYFEVAFVPLGLFAAIVTPLLLCPDRRDGVLSLYAARPVEPSDYVAARWIAALSVTLASLWFPTLLLWVWNLLDASDKTDFVRDEWEVLPRLGAAGLLVAGPFATLALTTASFTVRRAYAAVATLAVVFVGAIVGGIAQDDFSGGIADAVALANLPQAVLDAVRWTFGDERSPDQLPVSGRVAAAWVVALTVALGVVLFVRTRRLMRT